MTHLRRDLNVAVRVVWLIVSVVILLILASPFVLGPDRVAKLAPVCQSKLRDGTPCSFCGMTTSFLAISEGRFDEAGRANRGGIPLYALFIMNEIGILVFLRKGGLACKYSA